MGSESLGRQDEMTLSVVLKLAALAPTTWKFRDMHILGPLPDLLNQTLRWRDPAIFLRRPSHKIRMHMKTLRMNNESMGSAVRPSWESV